MIFIVLPVFNEEENIKGVVGEIHRTLKKMPHKIVAVNDGSKDSSLKILEKLKGKQLAYETYRTNMNVGAVFATGIARVLKDAQPDDVMIIMEADGTSAVDRIVPLLAGLKQNDIVIASRYVSGGAYKNFPFTRRIFSHFASLLLRYYFPIADVRDYTIFYRAYRIRIIQKAVASFGLFGLIQSLGFVANAELLIKLSFFTGKISEIPFIYDYGKKQGESKMNVVRTINEYFTVLTYLQGVRRRLR